MNAKELGAQPAMLSIVNEYVMRELNSTRIQGGLTKRELFAAMAMQGILSHGETPAGLTTASDVVEVARWHADYLLELLAKDSP